MGWTDVAEADLGFVEEALLLEELGYALYPGPFLQHVARLPAQRGRHAPSMRRGRSQRRRRRCPELRAAMAAEAVGIAQRALDLGVEHAKTREQFGKPIGTYQAVSHPLAQTYTDVELARSLAYWAAWCVAEDDERAAARRSRREGVRDRSGRRRVRALDPGARRHGLHVGAPAPPLLQARHLARGLRHAAVRAAARRSQTPCSAENSLSRDRLQDVAVPRTPLRRDLQVTPIGGAAIHVLDRPDRSNPPAGRTELQLEPTCERVPEVDHSSTRQLVGVRIPSTPAADTGWRPDGYQR